VSLIFCKCGCGGEFEEFDSRNRPRKYIKGHGSKNKKCPKISERQRGKLNHNYKGGSINSVSRSAKIRDDYTCQICGHREPEIMEADHIIPKSIQPSIQFELSNLITLCPNYHRRKTNREKKAHNYKRSD